MHILPKASIGSLTVLVLSKVSRQCGKISLDSDGQQKVMECGLCQHNRQTPFAWPLYKMYSMLTYFHCSVSNSANAPFYDTLAIQPPCFALGISIAPVAFPFCPTPCRAEQSSRNQLPSCVLYIVSSRYFSTISLPRVLLLSRNAMADLLLTVSAWSAALFFSTICSWIEWGSLMLANLLHKHVHHVWACMQAQMLNKMELPHVHVPESSIPFPIPVLFEHKRGVFYWHTLQSMSKVWGRSGSQPYC